MIAVFLETLKSMMVKANRKKKSHRRKLDMGLEVVIRNVKQETPIVKSGKSEEGGNMDAPTLVGKKNSDQDQNKREEEVSVHLAT